MDFLNHSRIAILLVMLSVPSCTGNRDVIVPENNAPVVLTEPDVLTIRFDEATSLAVEAAVSSGESLSKSSQRLSCLDDALSSLGAVSLERIFPYDPRFEERQRREGLHRYYRVRFNRANADVTKAGVELSRIDGVVSVSSPHRIRPASAFPFNDVLSPKQWSYYNDGSLHPSHKAGADIDVLRVWEQYTAGSPDVVVAVVDGGVDMSHPDLKNVVLPVGEGGSKDFCNNGGVIVPDLHGTHVAGTIGASNNNTYCVSGIAGGSDGTGGVRLMSCQIFVGDKSGNSAEAIVWACNNGALICNNSWGYDYNSQLGVDSDSIDDEDKAAIDYFIKYAGCDNDGNQLPGSLMKGGLVVFAAGNEGFYDAHPASYEPVVAVGAVGPDLGIASYTNYGKTVDICAPGGDRNVGGTNLSSILSTSPVEEQYSGTGMSESAYLDGTSMACPHVSAVAALLVSHFGGDGFTCEMLKERLLGGANSVATRSFEKHIGPLLDAFGSFVYGTDYLPSSFDFIPLVDGRNISFRIALPDNAYAAYVGIAESEELLQGFNPFGDIPDGVVVYSANGAPGDTVTVSGPLEMFTSYSAVAVVSDRDRCSGLTGLVSFTTQGNHSPEATGLPYVLVDSVGCTTDFALSELISDKDGDDLKYECTLSDERLAKCTVDGGVLHISTLAAGRAVLSVKAVDIEGESASTTAVLVVRPAGLFAELYPMPATSYVNVATMEDSNVEYEIYLRSDKPVLRGAASCSLLAPGRVDISSLSAGIYTMRLSCEGEVYEYQVVKI